MRKLSLIVVLLCTALTFAQQGINYKALIKDANNTVVANQNITVQFAILQGVAQINVYEETHTPTTDANGIIIINIGEGTVVSGVFDDIDWSSDDHFLNTQINTGAGLIDLGTTGFKTVPYALSAKTAESAENVSGLETINEGNGPGLVKVARNAANYGNVGFTAVDLSFSGGASSTLGATGAYSIAMGNNTSATSESSTAMGFNTTASDRFATAMGVSSVASGLVSTAMGSSTIASGSNSLAVGRNSESSGFNAVATGDGVLASGFSSTAMGNNTTASGNQSVAIGWASNATGLGSVVFGHDNDVTGNYATAAGLGTQANAYGSIAFGLYNVGGGNPTSIVPSDPLFEIGNGGGNASRNNALTVLKNGNVGIGTPSPSDALVIENGRMEIRGFSNATGVPGTGTIEIGDNLRLSSGRITTNTGGILNLQDGNSGDLRVDTNTLTVDANLDRVGINTLFPSEVLDVFGSAKINGSAEITGNLQVDNTTFYLNSANNRVGLGTSFPNATLDVRGQVIAVNDDNPALIVTGSSDTTAGDNGIISSNPNYLGSDLFLRSYDAVVIELDFDDNETGTFEIENGAGNNVFVVNESGTVTVNGSAVHSSDRRLKKDIQSIPYGLNEILKLQPKAYFWKDREQQFKSLGLIAQDVQEVISNVVQVANDDQRTLGISYTELIPVLIKGTQEQQKLIEEQKTLIENQNKRLQALEAQNKTLLSLEARLKALENNTNTTDVATASN